MPLSELARYRLSTVGRLADETATNALEAEAQQRVQAQAQARRAAVARVVGGFNPGAGGPDQVYGETAKAVTGLMGVGGPEAESAAGNIRGLAETYGKLHPQFAPRATPKPSEDWLTVTDQSQSTNPLVRNFGTVPHKLVRKFVGGQPTDMYDYVSLGAPKSEAAPGSSQKEKNAEKYRLDYLKENQKVSDMESYYSKDRLSQWREELKKDSEAQNILSAGSDFDFNKFLGDMVAQDEAKAGKAEKIRALRDYEKSLSGKGAHQKALNGIGYQVDDATGELVSVNPKDAKKGKATNDPLGIR